MSAIRCEGVPGQMYCRITDIPAFPGRHTSLGYPESIGDAARPVWYGGLEPTWERAANGVWSSRGRRPGELAYELTVTPHADFVESRYRLTNESHRHWEQSLAFNCVPCGSIPEVRDHEGLRTWSEHGGQLRRLTDLPRVFGPRPTIQLYTVPGAPPGKDIPFVASFRATPDVVLGDWMAVCARDGRRLIATVSRPALFLFQNLEYGCIHSANGFGALAPGQTGEGLNRVYFVTASLADWRATMRRDLAPAAGGPAKVRS